MLQAGRVVVGGCGGVGVGLFAQSNKPSALSSFVTRLIYEIVRTIRTKPVKPHNHHNSPKAFAIQISFMTLDHKKKQAHIRETENYSNQAINLLFLIS